MTPEFFANPIPKENFMADFSAAGIAGVIGVFVMLYFLAVLLSMAFSMACYVLHSLGLYTVANRRRIRNSWLAWIPIGNLWLLGSISDQYQYVVKGKIRNRRKVLLWLSLASVIVYLVGFVWMVIHMISSHGNPETVNFVGFGALVIWLLVLLSASVVSTVFQYLAYYDVFLSCNKENAVLYLVLAIVFPVTLPFFVFVSRKKDMGMPPKRQDSTQEPPVQLPDGEQEIHMTEEEGFAQPEEFEDI